MKVAIRYQSRGGNTKAVAEAIAKAVGVTAEPFDVPFSEPVDLLFVGGGVYMWDIDKSLKIYLESLDFESVKFSAIFSTSGGMDGTGKIADILKSRGVNVINETLPMKFLTRNLAWLGGKGHIILSDKDLDFINIFVSKVIDKI